MRLIEIARRENSSSEKLSNLFQGAFAIFFALVTLAEALHVAARLI